MATETTSGPECRQEDNVERIACAECGRPTNHKIVKSAEYVTEYEDRDFTMTSWDAYQVIACLGCQTTSFRHTHKDTEAFDHDAHTGEMLLDETARLYPQPETGRHEMNDCALLPFEILGVYRETLTALNEGLPILVGVGIRAIVETICRDRGSAGNSLAQKIDGLVAQGVLSSSGAETLHRLRVMGNKAAHEVRPHATTVLNAAIDVIEHVLTGVYVMPDTSRRLNQLPSSA